MESMILVLTPRECADLLNGDLSVLVRKKFSKDYVGWVYIYCTKDDKQELCYIPATETFYCYSKDNIVAKQCGRMGLTFNSKVTARFWCNKVEEIIDRDTKEKNRYSFGTETLQIDELEKMSRLNIQELCKYIGRGTEWRYGKYGYAIHVTKVEPFDKPKEISEFKRCKETNCYQCPYSYNEGCSCGTCIFAKPLTHAPTTYCYIEVDA